MRWAFTRSSETVKQPVLFYFPCMTFARAWASHIHRAWQISFLPSLQMFRFQRGFLIYVKIMSSVKNLSRLIALHRRCMDALTKSSVDSLLEKMRHLASRPVPEFNRFEALNLLEALRYKAREGGLLSPYVWDSTWESWWPQRPVS